MTDGVRTGACLCGAVRYRAREPLRPVIRCHCNQCQRWSGHVVAATQAGRDWLEIADGGELRWFESSPGIRRGFCGRCGSSLFWDDSGTASVSIMAGTPRSADGAGDPVRHLRRRQGRLLRDRR